MHRERCELGDEQAAAAVLGGGKRAMVTVTKALYYLSSVGCDIHIYNQPDN